MIEHQRRVENIPNGGYSKKINNILRENNVSHYHSAHRPKFEAPIKMGMNNGFHKESKRFSHTQRERSLMSDQLNSKKFGDYNKMNYHEEYGINEAGRDLRNLKGKMETVQEIKLKSQFSEQNSNKIEESLLNQSNYRVDLQDTFGKNNQ